MARCSNRSVGYSPRELPLLDRLLGKPPDIEDLRRAIVELTAEAAP